MPCYQHHLHVVAAARGRRGPCAIAMPAGGRAEGIAVVQRPSAALVRWWCCPRCTLNNALSRYECEACGWQRPRPPRPPRGSSGRAEVLAVTALRGKSAALHLQATPRCRQPPIATRPPPPPTAPAPACSCGGQPCRAGPGAGVLPPARPAEAGHDGPGSGRCAHRQRLARVPVWLATAQWRHCRPHHCCCRATAPPRGTGAAPSAAAAGGAAGSRGGGGGRQHGPGRAPPASDGGAGGCLVCCCCCWTGAGPLQLIGWPPCRQAGRQAVRRLQSTYFHLGLPPACLHNSPAPVPDSSKPHSSLQLHTPAPQPGESRADRLRTTAAVLDWLRQIEASPGPHSEAPAWPTAFLLPHSSHCLPRSTPAMDPLSNPAGPAAAPSLPPLHSTRRPLHPAAERPGCA